MVRSAKPGTVDLSKLAPQGQPADPQGQQYEDPTIVELNNKIDQLTGKVTNFQTAQEQSRQQQITSAIEAFKTEADDQGNLTHPHFDKVKPIMGGLINANPQLTLSEAYDQAVFADPTIRTDLLAQREQAAKEEAEKAARAQRAQAASKSLKGSPPDREESGQPVDPTNLRALLSEGLAEQRGGVRV